MKKHSFWGLYIISLFDLLVCGVMILFLITPFTYSFDNFFGKSVPIIVIFLYYLIWGGIGYICVLTSWKTLRFKPDIRLGNIFISILILIFSFFVAEFLSRREINPKWFLRFIYFYVLWSICYILRPRLRKKIIAYNHSAKADVK